MLPRNAACTATRGAARTQHPSQYLCRGLSAIVMVHQRKKECWNERDKCLVGNMWLQCPLLDASVLDALCSRASQPQASPSLGPRVGRKMCSTHASGAASMRQALAMAHACQLRAKSASLAHKSYQVWKESGEQDDQDESRSDRHRKVVVYVYRPAFAVGDAPAQRLRNGSCKHAHARRQSTTLATVALAP